MLNPLNLLSKIIKSSNQREIERINNIVKKINPDTLIIEGLQNN